MNKRSYISLIFGLLFVITFTGQIVDDLMHWSDDMVTIELSESNEDHEVEEEDIQDELVLYLNTTNVVSLTRKHSDPVPLMAITYCDITSKIHLPPPELA